MYNISIVVPTLGRADLMRNMLNSYLDKHDLSKSENEFIVINNGADEEISALKEEFSERLNGTLIIHNEPENLGVVKSWNKGVELATYDHIAILNNDIEFMWEDSLYKMSDTLTKKPKVFWTSPITCYDREQKVITSFKISHYEQLRLSMNSREYIVGCCFMCPRKAFEELGMFDEGFDIRYYEDLDYINRILESRHLLAQTMESAIYHAVGLTSIITPGGANNENYYKEKWEGSNFNILTKQPGREPKGFKHFD